MVREIGKKLDNSNYKDFKFWATDPKNGVKGEDDDDLYSMTVIIDPYAKNNTLNCINQSNRFDKNDSVLKKAKEYSVMFKL